MKEPITMLIIRSTGAQAPTVLPPVHPECKEITRFQALAGVQALQDCGEFLEAEKLKDVILRVCFPSPHNKS
jgi:hypothetical protein